MNFLNRIDPQLRVGPSCFHMNISGIYEGMGALYLSLGYTNMDFIYNKEIFTEFINPKPSIEYISKTNDLVIAENIDSKYIDCTYTYLDFFSNIIYKPIIETIEFDGDIDLHELKSNYLDKGLPVMYTCDHYYTYEDYIKLTSSILNFHSKGHMAILSNLDFENEIAFVVDKFYKFKGNVQLENLKKSIYSEHLNEQKFLILRLKDYQYVNEINGFDVAFIKNFRQTLKPEIVIDGMKYDKNIKAIESFAEDFKDIIASLYDQKGKYAPQFFSKLISSTILQRVGFSNLLGYVLHLGDSRKYKELSELSETSKELWTLIDVYNDKYYLKGKIILEAIDAYRNLLDQLVINDSKLYELMKGFVS